MNTKQIWQVLTCNTKTEPYFDGVFSIDMLHKIKINLNKSFVTQIHQLNLESIGYYSSFIMILLTSLICWEMI